MALAETPFTGKVREELLDRRARLEDVLSRNESEQMQHLLAEVDHALERMNVGKFGLCEVCHDTIEAGPPCPEPRQPARPISPQHGGGGLMFDTGIFRHGSACFDRCTAIIEWEPVLGTAFPPMIFLC